MLEIIEKKKMRNKKKKRWSWKWRQMQKRDERDKFTMLGSEGRREEEMNGKIKKRRKGGMKKKNDGPGNGDEYKKKIKEIYSRCLEVKRKQRRKEKEKEK